MCRSTVESGATVWTLRDYVCGEGALILVVHVDLDDAFCVWFLLGSLHSVILFVRLVVCSGLLFVPTCSLSLLARLAVLV